MALARRDIENTDDLKILDLVFLHSMSIPSNRYSDSVYRPPNTLFLVNTAPFALTMIMKASSTHKYVHSTTLERRRLPYNISEVRL